MAAVLYSEINILCILFLLLMYVKVKYGNYSQHKRLLFCNVLLSTALLFALDAAWIWVNSKIILVEISVNWGLNLLYYFLSGLVGFYWFIFSESMQQSKLISNKKRIFICAIPILILYIMSIASIKTGWMFYIDTNNVYHRGTFYFLQLLFSYGYVLFTAIKALFLSVSSVQYTQKVEYRTLAYFVIAPLIAGGVQVFFPTIPALCIGITFGSFYVFITMQDQMISIDTLTGLNNRSKLMRHLFSRMEDYDGKTRLFLAMMDLDYFKAINDVYGHVEGDNALRITASALKNCGKNHNCFIARYGGDEFAAVCQLDTDEEMQRFCHTIVKTLQQKSDGCPYKLSLSIGYAEYTPTLASDQEFIKLADAKLYESKQSHRKTLTSTE